MRTFIRAERAFVTALGAALLSACGGDSPTEPVDPTPVTAATVQATPAEQFTPTRIDLTIGGTITFAFGSLEHNVFFDNQPAGAPANIPDPSANKQVTRTFTTAGTYVYVCHIHPQMRGTVVVK
jgi:plastocyanin